MKKYQLCLALILNLFGTGCYAVNTALTIDGSGNVLNPGDITYSNGVLVVGFLAGGGATSVVTHSLVSSNAGNSIAILRNYAPTGNAGMIYKERGGSDSAAIYLDNTTSNLFIRNFLAGRSVKISVDGGSGGLLIYQNVATNTGSLAVTGTLTVGGSSVPTVTATNVMVDFPNILAAAGANLNYSVAGVITNMPCILGNAAGEDISLNVNAFVSSNGFVTLRARNVGSLAVDQANLPYRIQVVTSPTN